MTTRTVIKPTSEELSAALTLSNGNVSAAAKDLGVSRVTVHKWMREYGIKVERVVADSEDIPDLVA